ncbi:hypothetical protein SORBI_3004G060832 [Sorghum bicolor]|uniref:B box-type domain-containing protein n=1 Tax=Sorghum bicolor TaxID=4558 RepID=A0A1Z5RM72_SORBI|nr:hypothetical protein SORBI_3004G060832 [Sorghum bicolor]
MGVASDAAAGGKRGTGTGTRCELCGGAAAVHCAADSAFLCLRCDAKVHGANFLASRHLRRRLPRPPSAADSGAASSASSSSCVSTADSAESTAAAPLAGRAPARRRPRAAAEAVLEGWAKRMGLAAPPPRSARWAGAWPPPASRSASRWPPRSGPRSPPPGDAAALLRRLEAAAHVPARLVLTVASWMARAGSRPAAGPAADADGQDQDQEEGWAECS